MDVNANGGSDIKVPKFHPIPGQTQIASAGPVSADAFWNAEDQLIASTGRKIGHHTYEPWGYLGVGAVAGIIGDTALPTYLASKSNKILANMPPESEKGTYQPSRSQQWAENYRANYNSASAARDDLDTKGGAQEYFNKSADLEEQQRQLRALRDDLTKANEPNGAVSERLSKFAADNGKPLTTEVEKSSLAQYLMQQDKNVTVALKELEYVNNPARNFALPKNAWGGYGGARGAAAVALSMVVDNYADRIPSLLPDSVQSALGLEQRDPKLGLSSGVALAAVTPLAYAADLGGKLGYTGFKGFGINTGVALAAGGATYIGGKFLNSMQAPATFPPQAIDSHRI